MAKNPETLFKEKVQDFLKTLPNTWSLKTQERTIRGIPDILLCVKGQFVAIELKKSDKDEPDPLQDFNLNKITKAGGASFCAFPENWPEVMRVLIKLATGQVVIKAQPTDTEDAAKQSH